VGEWLPAVPVVAVYPDGAHWDDPAASDRDGPAASAWEIAAVLTSPFASTWLWHRSAGTGLGARSVRLSPVVLADLPWPAGGLAHAVDALRTGDVRACARMVDDSYGVPDQERLTWWLTRLDRIERANGRWSLPDPADQR
jgi:hypothetical protein